MLMEKVKKNCAKCLICGDVLVSDWVHDFRTCSCGNLSVDGGLEYIRRCCNGGREAFQELSDVELVDEPLEEYYGSEDVVYNEEEDDKPVRRRWSDYV